MHMQCTVILSRRGFAGCQPRCVTKDSIFWCSWQCSALLHSVVEGLLAFSQDALQNITLHLLQNITLHTLRMYFDAVGSAEGLLAFSQDGPRTHPLILSRLHCQPNHPHIYHHDLSVKAGHPPPGRLTRRALPRGPFPKGATARGTPHLRGTFPKRSPVPFRGTPFRTSQRTKKILDIPGYSLGSSSSSRSTINRLQWAGEARHAPRSFGWLSFRQGLPVTTLTFIQVLQALQYRGYHWNIHQWWGGGGGCATEATTLTWWHILQYCAWWVSRSKNPSWKAILQFTTG